MWDWTSPVAWAVFLVGAGVCALLLGMAVERLASAGKQASTIKVPKRRR